MVGFEQYTNLSRFSGHCSGWCGDVVVQNNGVLDSLDICLIFALLARIV